MVSVDIRVPKPEEVVHVAKDLRHSDVNELILATGCRDMIKLIARSCFLSEVCFGLYYDEKIVGLAGATEGDLQGWSIPWMVATPEFENDKKAAVHVSKRLFNELIQRYPKMANFVSAENETSIRWLSWLGFVISRKAHTFGPNNAEFYRFSIEGAEACAT